jgi:glutathione peroxidase-family protein
LRWLLTLLCTCGAAAKFIIDKQGNVVERNGDNPLASEAKIKQLLAA